MNTRNALALALLSALIASACGAATTPTANTTADPTPEASLAATPTPTPTPVATATQAATPVPVLRDGPIEPGTYFYVPYSCNPPRDCSDVDPKEFSLPGLEVTVPSSKWRAATEFLAIWPKVDESQSAALIMGWTNVEVGLNSEPCSQVSHQTTDIEVGPSVDDFVDAVVAHPTLDNTNPIDVELGGFSGRFFTLTTPAAQSGCEEWRPWDPGFYAQGPNNIWDVWVIDVDGTRLVIVADYFPDTPEDIKSDLRAMAESIRFVP